MGQVPVLIHVRVPVPVLIKERTLARALEIVLVEKLRLCSLLGDAYKHAKRGQPEREIHVTKFI